MTDGSRGISLFKRRDISYGQQKRNSAGNLDLPAEMILDFMDDVAERELGLRLRQAA